ncbi:hypothetical protein [Aquimarina mytili]|uniref:Uncharacterized protein n=1 Tax=Aquimarina mytili TaxID=874423 RepID=A0A936ZVK0_9FLAO|nr:hypothetical protein [Aquimarina mytili]MBL0685458.1 hypothetical protein [Aquimarina mytili]
MLKNILKVTGTQQLNKNDQKSIKGGFGNWPTTEEQCLQCGGEWGGIAFGTGGLCLLSRTSPCA